MKRLLSIFVIMVFMFGLTKAASGDLRDWMDNLSTDNPFGYVTTQKIAISQITADKIVINSPTIKDEFGAEIKKYTLMFSQYPLSKILENASLLDQSKEKTFDFTNVSTGVVMELTTADGVDPNILYYVAIIPKDQNGIL